MIEHGKTCAGEPCTCDCYTRHAPLPGVHQDTPHPKSECAVLVPSSDVAQPLQLAINRVIHDAWQQGYAAAHLVHCNGCKDCAPERGSVKSQPVF